MLEIQALIKIMEKKGITNQDEISKEVVELKKEMEIKIKNMSKGKLILILFKYFCAFSKYSYIEILANKISNKTSEVKRINEVLGYFFSFYCIHIFSNISTAK
jgi:hypothetical protein